MPDITFSGNAQVQGRNVDLSFGFPVDPDHDQFPIMSTYKVIRIMLPLWNGVDAIGS